MNTEALEQFAAVAKAGSITKAAYALGISQPAVSRTILSLENEFGFMLFDRIGKYLHLNAQGEIVYKHISDVLENYNELYALLSDMNDLPKVEANVGLSFSGNSPPWLVEIMLWFIENYPDVKLRFQQMDPSQLIDSLLSHEIDFGISSLKIEKPNVKWADLFSEEMGIMLSVSHPLVKKDILSLTDLKDEQFLLYSHNSDLKHFTIDMCERVGFYPQIKVDIDTPELIGEIVSKTQGVSFISRNQYYYLKEQNQYYFEKGLTFRQISQDYCMRTCSLCVLDNHYIRKLTRVYINYIFEKFGLQGPFS